jgi:DNA invertase Pin-like site-specific DNA recombinase
MKLELLGFAEKERQLIKQRTKATLQSMKRNGFKVGNHNAVITPTMIANSIASRKQEARLNENNLKAYNEFKLIREQGKNFSEIAREFNKKGVLTSRGKQWQATQVKRLVKLYNG